MSTFTALNVEPDDEPTEDIDNTREIQIEEAIKLYQAALRLHGQGPKSYPQAAIAYEALFKSEIFSLTESLTEFERIQLQPESENEVELAITLGLELAAINATDTSNSLPQILYLAYKNHGLFVLDCIKHRVHTRSTSDPDLKVSIQTALDNIIKALARDESDTELWRRAAYVGLAAGSTRIMRYCLEAALEVDDDPTQAEVEPATLEEGFAGVALYEVLDSMQDSVALSHPIMAPYRSKSMGKKAQARINPYPFLADISADVLADEAPSVSSVRLNVQVSDRSWDALGNAMLSVCLHEPYSCRAIKVIMPDITAVDESMLDTPSISAAIGPRTFVGSPNMEANGEVPSAHNDIEDLPLAAAEESPSKVDGMTDIHTIIPSENTIIGDAQQESGSLKRSQSNAGIRDVVEDENTTQKRSKRIRNRDTFGPENPPPDATPTKREQLADYIQADANMFTFINTILEKLELPILGSIDTLLDIADGKAPTEYEGIRREALLCDIREILVNWDEAKAAAYTAGTQADVLGAPKGGPAVGLPAFLEHLKASPTNTNSAQSPPPDDGVDEFANKVNSNWLTKQDVVFHYLACLRRSYASTTWPETIKFNVTQLMVLYDAEVYKRILDVMQGREGNSCYSLASIESLTQMLFELHIDLLTSITVPGSGHDAVTIAKERDRLTRWSVLAGRVMEHRNQGLRDELTIRFLWSSVLYVNLQLDTSRHHVISLWNDMKDVLHRHDGPIIVVRNNTALTEISGDAADREISKLTSTDFFLRLFNTDQADPVVVIETLEPVLLPQSKYVDHPNQSTTDPDNNDGLREELESSRAQVSVELQNIWKFLEGGSGALRLFLWQRLREAYQKIDYPTKVFSCCLKSIEVIVSDMMMVKFGEHCPSNRQNTILEWVKTLDDLLVKALTHALNETTAFDIIDLDHIKTSCTALIELCLWLHSVALLEDQIRVGHFVPTAHQKRRPWVAFIAMIREMQIRAWALLYTLLKDGMTQRRELFPAMDSDLADYLSVVHLQFGLRKSCRNSNKILLKMMKVELLRLKHVERWDDYLGQVLYDLYEIKLGSGVYVLGDHGVTSEPLDKRTSLTIMEKVVELAHLLPIKDLLKSELRPTIEAMQKAIGAFKPTPTMQCNARNITAWLKGTINPREAYMAMKGQLCIDLLTVRADAASPVSVKHNVNLGRHGWYFMLGILSLTKFKSQKRLVPGAASDELREAVAFFKLQIQLTPENWEAWYRLAQCFDAELEENILFSADKLNSEADRKPVAATQRQAIKCYMMACSVAARSAMPQLETASKLADMYHDFGVRVYASSREPFAMEAFYLDGFEHFFSGTNGMYKGDAHSEMQRSQAWKFAATLFEKAKVAKPENWLNHYMLGKTLWKLYTRASDGLVSSQKILRVFETAIQTCPKTATSQGIILEPHFKYMSTVHKLVMAHQIDLQSAADHIQRQHFHVNNREHIQVTTLEEYKTFIMDAMRVVQHVDKANWHHRIIYRMARIMHGVWMGGLHVSASDAMHVLTKTMFTKTMAFNVWKPEFERPGRHCVYSETYIKYMVELLVYLHNREDLSLLCKRVRRKQADIYHYHDVWKACVEGYLNLLARHARDEVNRDFKDHHEALLNTPSDEFNARADALKKYLEQTPQQLPVYARFIKETDELKRLNLEKNVAIFKTSSFDDLMIKLYANVMFDVEAIMPPSKVSAGLPALVAESSAAVAVAMEQRQQGPMSISSMLGIVDTPAIPQELSMESQALTMIDATSKPRSRPASRSMLLRRAEALVSHIITDPVRAAQVKTKQSKQVSISSEPRVARVIEGAESSDDEVTVPAVEVDIGAANVGATAEHRTENGNDQDGENQGGNQELEEDGPEMDRDVEKQGYDQDEPGNNSDEGVDDAIEDQGDEVMEDETMGGIEDDGDEADNEQGDMEDSEGGSVQDSADDESDLSDASREEAAMSGVEPYSQTQNAFRDGGWKTHHG